MEVLTYSIGFTSERHISRKSGNINTSLYFSPLHPLNRFRCIKESIFTPKMKKKNIKLLFFTFKSFFKSTTNSLFDMPAAWQQDTEQTQTDRPRENLRPVLYCILNHFIPRQACLWSPAAIYQLPTGLRLFQSQHDWPGTE